MLKLMTVVILVMGVISCNKDKPAETKKAAEVKPAVEVPEAEKALLNEAKITFQSIQGPLIDVEKNADLIALGKKLYFEKALSINNTISCNSCHMLDKYGVDNEATSPGHDGTRGGRNSPTSYYAALHFKQFWDGRAADVEEQALGPILNPIEHGLKSEADAMKKINTPEYMAEFKKAFGSDTAFTYKNVGVAIGAFEKTLMPRSRFDDYLDGDWKALNDQEKKGLKSYIDIGCTQCHAGVALGGTSFRKLGEVEPYETKDEGRFEVTKKNRDKFKFKVPGLRNVEKTYPYFHDGSIKTLDEAIKLMAWHQLGEKIEDAEVADIKAFLSSLTAKELKF
jgi:cytochrome c peroxidase